MHAKVLFVVLLYFVSLFDMHTYVVLDLPAYK